MAQAIRLVRLIQIGMLASIALYVLLGEAIRTRFATSVALYYGISFVSISLVGAIMVVRRTQVLQWEVRLAEKPDDGAALGRWKAGQITTYALCEALALLGFLLRVVGFRLVDVWPYYLGGFALMLVFWPRLPQREFN